MSTPAELRAIQLASGMAYKGEVIALDVENFCASTGADVGVVRKALAAQNIQVVSYECPEYKPYYLKAHTETIEMGRVAKLRRLHTRVAGGNQNG